MTKIKPKAIEQMREILSGIVLGRLRHNQGTWHCGTAGCVAGWNTALNHKELYENAYQKLCVEKAAQWGRQPEQIHWSLCDLPGQENENDDDIAKRDWGLSEGEAEFMFAGPASLEQQIGLIEFLADGHRAPDWWDGEDYPLPDKLQEYVDQYDSSAARLAWAKKYEQPRPNTDVVEDLLKPTAKKPAKKQEVVEEVVEVVTATK